MYQSTVRKSKFETEGKSFPVLPWAIGAIILTLTAFYASTWSLFQALLGNNPNQLLLLLPLSIMAATTIQVMRYNDGVQLTLFKASILLGLSTIIMLVGPIDSGYTFWFLRVDLIAFILYYLGVMTAIFGFAWIFRTGTLAILALLAAPPVLGPLFQHFEAGITNLTQGTAGHLAGLYNLHYSGNGIFATPSGGTFTITTVCAGLEGFSMLALLLPPVLIALSGSKKRFWAYTALFCVAIWIANFVRVLILLGLTGHPQAFSVVHEWSGLLILVSVLASYLFFLPRAGLELDFGTKEGSEIILPTRHIAWMAAIIGITFVGVIAAESTTALQGLQSFQVKEPVKISLQKNSLSWNVPGYTTRLDNNIAGFDKYYGVNWSGAYSIYRPDQESAWAQVIVTDSIYLLSKYNEINCFVSHNAKIYHVSRVPLGKNGSALQVHQYRDGMYMSTLSWIQPVTGPNGQRLYRRILLFAVAPPATPHMKKANANNDTPGYENFIYAIRNKIVPIQLEHETKRDWQTSDQTLQSVAGDIIKSKV